MPAVITAVTRADHRAVLLLSVNFIVNDTTRPPELAIWLTIMAA